MDVAFSPQEGFALYRLLAEGTSDIILKTDRYGAILHASAGTSSLGLPSPDRLQGRRIVDLVHPQWAKAIESRHAAVISGREDDSWIEFPLMGSNGGEQWFAIRTRRLCDERDRAYGAVSVLRSVEERRSYEERLFTAAMTDPLTGATNRPAFITMLRHLVETRVGGCLAIFNIDHFKAINMRYGQAAGDEVLVAFADYLRTMLRSSDIVSRIGGESLGVLLPRTTPVQAEAVCRRIVETLADLSGTAEGSGIPITASAGVARIAGSLDSTMKRAEVALALAKAKGRNRLEMDAAPTLTWSGSQPH